MFISQSLSGVPIASILRLILCSIGDNITQLLLLEKSQMVCSCCTKSLNKVQKDDLIICAELSRLGRNLFMIMEILNICMGKECRVWTIKDNYRLGEDIQSKVLAFAFGLSAEIERNLISQRTKEALARKKTEGVVLGRPKGKKSAPEKYKLHDKKILIQELLKAKVSQRKIAKICKVDRNTLARFIKTFMVET